MTDGKIAVEPHAIDKFSTPPLQDNHGRIINYVRLSVTDRCNLRCRYCMPENMRFMPAGQLLSFPEMERLLRILAPMGISKVRLTGGEPFVRRGILPFLNSINKIKGIERIHITTNGVLTAKYLDDLKNLKIAGINLSLDTLDPDKFYQITRRKDFAAVWDCFHKILQTGIPLKVNMVLLGDQNAADIIPMATLARDYPVEIRIIEEMPFDGSSANREHLRWDYRRIIDTFRAQFPNMQPLEPEPSATSRCFKVPGHLGSFGVIAGFSRTFCGSCNRIRVTAKGDLQTCLYGKGVFNIRDLMRSGSSDADIRRALVGAIGNRFKDGWEAQQNHSEDVLQSMSIIGG